MPDFPIHTVDSAPEGSKDILAQFEKKLGFNINLFGLLAESPAALKAYPAISDVFDQTDLTPTEQQVVLLTTSVENECKFCVAAHSTIAKKNVGVEEEIVDAIRENREGPDQKLNALAQFTRTIVEERGFIDDSDLQSFLDAGYTKANVLDVIVGVTLKTLTNYANHLIDTPLNDAFADEKWDPEMKKAA